MFIFAPMIRIGRQIPHFEQVDPQSIGADFSADRRFRYRLTLRYADSLYDRDRSKQASVILKNPSAADTQGADSTIRKVETFVYHHLEEVKVLHILNLFALRATEALDVNREYKSAGYEAVVGERNDHVIRETVEASDYLLVAWGNRSGIHEAMYDERILQVKNLLAGISPHRVFEVKGQRETSHPLHGMMWGYDYELVPYLKMK